ncbi:glycoside hydrolase family 32 protein [Paenibacillus koleovorans]|uniref:glycoside hydrolase family 32 protein n=1 Tax=Paenibacillus koleovorans TaxID=121608 RepID=UPI000FD8BED1|nr:glycoside hydrolase family 32 protein [Paenibacillus koleovorans]
MYSKQLQITGDYLNLPVRNKAPKRLVQLIVDEKTVRHFKIELAENMDEPVDLWVSTNISEFAGKAMEIRMPEPSGAEENILESLYIGDRFLVEDDLFKETYRPQFHFTTRKGWINDPNGLIYYKGEYHLFYQHNPFGVGWGNMHWGHAVSKDLIHWEELPVALYPDDLGMIYSGSSLIDSKDTSGLFDGGEGMVAFFSHAHGPRGQIQSFAYSTDDGRTWTKYENNPVLTSENEPDNNFRDPKVFWHEKTQRWIMAVYKAIAGKSSAAFYYSQDLKSWEFLSYIPGIHECPDVFELAVDGDVNNRKWVLLGVQGTYMLGEFDGHHFVSEAGLITFEYGTHFSATQSFAHSPDGYMRRVQLAWMRFGLYPDMPFNQQLTFPCELTLRNTRNGVRMFRNPAKEIEMLRDREQGWTNLLLSQDTPLIPELEGRLFDIELEIDLQDAEKIGLRIHDETIRYNAKDRYLKCFGKSVRTNLQGTILKLRILVDVTSIEIFVQDGEFTFSACYIQDFGSKPFELYAAGGTAFIKQLSIWELKSMY